MTTHYECEISHEATQLSVQCLHHGTRTARCAVYHHSSQEWTRVPGTPPVVKGLVWFTDWSRTAEETGAAVNGQSVGRRLSISLGKHATVFLTGVYAILACVYETETQYRPEKYVSICSDSQAAMKHFSLSKQGLQWHDSVKRRWMISLPDTL
jgi:hypothetical protein